MLNIDYHLTSQAFNELGVVNFDDVFTQFKQNTISDLFETGKASEDDFYRAIVKDEAISRDQFDKAWNAMLLDFPIARFELLKKLNKEFKLYLCSNTNSIHLRCFLSILNQYGLPFEELFDEVYYSHVVGLRKPNAEIFEFILKENNLIAEETLFLDDTIHHINGASKIGIQTIHVNKNTVEEIFADWLN